MEQRNVRASEARTEQTRAQEARTRHWKPPAQLEAPPERPGYKQKWIRKSLLSVDEPHNVASRIREGWEARPASSAPDWPASQNGLIEQGGLVLMEMPEHMVAERNEHYRGATAKQTKAIKENIHRDQHPRHAFQRQDTETVDVNRAGVPPVQEDD